jgi:hypothetical protein
MADIGDLPVSRVWSKALVLPLLLLLLPVLLPRQRLLVCLVVMLLGWQQRWPWLRLCLSPWAGGRPLLLPHARRGTS